MILVGCFFAGFIGSLLLVVPLRFGFRWLVGRGSIVDDLR